MLHHRGAPAAGDGQASFAHFPPEQRAKLELLAAEVFLFFSTFKLTAEVSGWLLCVFCLNDALDKKFQLFCINHVFNFSFAQTLRFLIPCASENKLHRSNFFKHK